MHNEETNENSVEKLDTNLANKDDQVKMMIERLEASSMFFESLPPLEILKAYELVQPGLAREVFEMAKQQSQHRREMEKIVIGGDSKRLWVGLIFGFIITLISIATGTFLIQQGHDVAGGIFAETPIVSMVTAFIYNTNQRSQERAEKQKALLEADKDDDNK